MRSVSTSRVVRDSGWLLIASVLENVFSFLIFVSVGRVLGQVALGQYSSALALTGLGLALSQQGLETLLVRECARDPARATAVVPNFLTLRLMLLLPILLAVNAIGSAMGREAGFRETLLWISLAGLVQGAGYIPYSYLQSRGAIGRLAAARAVEKAAALAAVCAALALGGTLPAVAALLLATRTAQQACHFAWTARTACLSLGRDVAWMLSALREALPYSLTAILQVAYFQIDVVLLALLTDDATTAVYAAGYRLMQMLLIVPQAINAASLPPLARLHEHDPSRGRSLALATMRVQLLVSIPMAVGLACVAEPLLVALYGAPGAASLVSLRILALAVPLAFVNLQLLTVLMAGDRPSVPPLATGVATALNVVANLVLIPRFGGPGAALATVLSELAILAIAAPAAARQLPFGALAPTLVRSSVAALVMAYALEPLSGTSLAVRVLAGAAVYAAATLALGEPMASLLPGREDRRPLRDQGGTS
jgi:O-antigen/teichoic acid export membrane protein